MEALIVYAAIAAAMAWNRAMGRKNEEDDYSWAIGYRELYRELKRARFARQNEWLINFAVSYTALTVMKIIFQMWQAMQ